MIDLIAGTSAGGLNGAILAQRIALGLDFPHDELRKLWIDHASITENTLLNKPVETSRWLLNGDFFLDQIRSVLTPPPDRSPQPGRRISLFTTATAVNGQSREVKDAADLTYRTRDSRRVYRFEHDPDRPEESDFASGELIAEATRASASFPGAFQPHDEPPELVANRALPRDPEATGELMDGGVLDNAPISLLLDELRRIPVAGAWRRQLVHINPTVEATSAPEPHSKDWLSQLGRLVTVIQEPDERLDQEALESAQNSNQYAELRPEAILEKWLTGSAGVLPEPDISREQFRFYRYLREQALLSKVDGAAVDHTLISRAVPPDPGKSTPWVFPVGVEPRWQWGISVALHLANWWGRLLNRLPSAPGEHEASIADAFAQVGELQALLRSVDRSVITGTSGKSVSSVGFIEFYQDTRNIARLTDHINRAAKAVGGVVKQNRDRVIDLSLRLEILMTTMTWGHELPQWPSLAFRRLTPAQPPIFSEYKESGPAWPTPAKKLYGQRWQHFGAFATTAGRKHDWLWGRLDAAAMLSDWLLAESPKKQQLREALADAILLEEFPGSDLAAARKQMLEGADAAMKVDSRKLLSDMEAENPGTFDNLKGVLWGLSGALTLPHSLRALLGAVLGQPGGDSTKVTSPIRALAWVVPQRWLENRVRSKLGLPTKPGRFRRGLDAVKRWLPWA